MTCVLALADRGAPPVTQALESQLFGARDRLPVMAALRSIRNLGFTLGAMLPAVALALDSRAGYSGVLVGIGATPSCRCT